MLDAEHELDGVDVAGPRIHGHMVAGRAANPVVCENSADGLRGLAIIELEHAEEPLTAAYWARPN